jgi:hypothetical protein
MSGGKLTFDGETYRLGLNEKRARRSARRHQGTLEPCLDDRSVLVHHRGSLDHQVEDPYAARMIEFFAE